MLMGRDNKEYIFYRVGINILIRMRELCPPILMIQEESVYYVYHRYSQMISLTARTRDIVCLDIPSKELGEFIHMMCAIYFNH